MSGFLTQLHAHQVCSFSTAEDSALQPLKIDVSGLAPIHVRRFLAGYVSLSESWARFSTSHNPLGQGLISNI
jgi:hypothetical protein